MMDWLALRLSGVANGFIGFALVGVSSGCDVHLPVIPVFGMMFMGLTELAEVFFVIGLSKFVTFPDG
jgi:hypothetical protein